MAYYKDLRQYLEFLEARGKLTRIRRPMVKETEILPLVRLQFRGLPEEERRAFLFEKVIDVKGRSYDGMVATSWCSASRQLVAWGMGCEDPSEIYERWHSAAANPLQPVLVESGPVQEEVHIGPELAELGLDELPIPVEDPGTSGTIRTTNQFITRDPETGIRNVGTYSGQIRARDRLVWNVSPIHHGFLFHWRKARAMGIPLQGAIVIGATPNVQYVGAANIPYGVDELAVAGGLAGEPVELVRCKTVDLEVPANAEIVIEVEISTEVLEPLTAFCEYPGYTMMVPVPDPIMKVTAITHRKSPIFTPYLVGMIPSDDSVLHRSVLECEYYHHLKYDCNLPVVQDVAFHDSGGATSYCVVRIKKTHPSQPWQVLYALMGKDPVYGKIAIVVDEDVNPQDPEMVNWALSFSMQPQRDIRILEGRAAGLDPSSAPHTTPGKDWGYPPPMGCSALLIDATRKWPYPPVGLATKEHMERAIELWREEGLPALKLRPPWHSYNLGLWREDDEENARLIVQGDYIKLGEKMARRQTPVEDEH
ncbi:MAG TPA: UbiD family decarboxylase [Dehalococcoidia bacterium]|nr:UbiD family decarboxylase [Dehalococcoidia bacterium]